MAGKGIERTPTAFRWTHRRAPRGGPDPLQREHGDTAHVRDESWARRDGSPIGSTTPAHVEGDPVNVDLLSRGRQRAVGGKRGRGLRIHTKRVEDLPPKSSRRSCAGGQAPQLRSGERLRSPRGAGWHIDDYRQPLPRRRPGRRAGRRVERAKQLMLDYEFADTKIVTAMYDEDWRSRPRHAARGALLEPDPVSLRSAGRRMWSNRSHAGRSARCASGAGATHAPGPTWDGPDGLQVVEVGYSGEVEFAYNVVSRPASIESDRPAGVSPVGAGSSSASPAGPVSAWRLRRVTT